MRNNWEWILIKVIISIPMLLLSVGYFLGGFHFAHTQVIVQSLFFFMGIAVLLLICLLWCKLQ